MSDGNASADLIVEQRILFRVVKFLFSEVVSDRDRGILRSMFGVSSVYWNSKPAENERALPRYVITMYKLLYDELEAGEWSGRTVTHRPP